jgi:ATP adenylyltransferase
MERLWTPWRMEYIKGTQGDDGCIFCALPSSGEDEASLILGRGRLAFIILNKFPYNPGHLMVVPFRHIAGYEELTSDEHGEITSLTARAMEALKAAYAPHGYNIGINQGRVAGAGIVDHIHLHVVPRWGGDTNFMTSVAEVKVLPEALDETYAKLRPRLSG